MRGAKAIAVAAQVLYLAACNADHISPKTIHSESAVPLIFGPEEQARLRTISCPDPDKFITPQSIPISVTQLTPDSLKGATLEGLAFAGGWHLESEDPNFGGLSGLAVHPKDHLLAVSDGGAFVWLSMADGAPSGFGTISYMRDENGNILDGKNAADSEGLTLAGGLALVSFEREHRVLAFDLANCGASANGILVANITNRPEGFGSTLPDNEGAEALFLDGDDHLVAGLEVKTHQGAPLVELTVGSARFETYIKRPSDKRLVGLDGRDDTLFALFRAYSPFTGNSNEIHAYFDKASNPKTVASLKRPFPVDNFEGITAMHLPDGTLRLYIIADNNFSDKQRTLLLAFDVLPDTELN